MFLSSIDCGFSSSNDYDLGDRIRVFHVNENNDVTCVNVISPMQKGIVPYSFT